MLIRVRGGESGIKEYLEYGKKSGRDLDRDSIDRRVILDGDLELTDAVIDGMTKQGEKYLHITLSFKEDNISKETLENITQDFKEFLFSAYQDDEYNFYAEAHLPKIKSYVHEGTGELVERKPHIHVVVPEQNLLTGNNLNPLGRVEHQTKFIDAFQEHTNAKYGLASPKDNRRYEITQESEMISRHKGDFFKGTNRELKDKILAAVLEKDISSYPDFKELLFCFGELKVRNEGKDSEYINIKPQGDVKGVNLKEAQFSKDWIEQPKAHKLQALSSEPSPYIEQTKARGSNASNEARLKEWHEVRARELKHINSGNRQVYKNFRDAPRQEKLVILADRESHFNAKHRSEDNERQQSERAITNLENDLRTASRHIQSVVGIDAGTAKAAGGIVNRRSARAVRAVVHRYIGDQEEPEQSGVKPTLAANITSQLLSEHTEQQQQAGSAPDIQEIKKNLDASRLLGVVSHSHGVQLARYPITTGKDGSDRIKCGNRNLNVSDFLTRELNLPFEEAKKILVETYQEQQRHQPQQVKRPPRSELWGEYRDIWKPTFFKAKQEAWQEQRQKEKNQRTELRENYYRLKGRVDANRAVPWAKRKAELSVAKMEKALETKRLAALFDGQRQQLKKHYQQPPSELYRLFLHEKAQQGNSAALAELRRQNSKPSMATTGTTTIQQPESDQRNKTGEIITKLDYSVNRRGDVKYSDGEKHLFTDAGSEVRTFDKNQNALETALRLSVQKFGRCLKVNGTNEYKDSVLKAAVKAGMAITFSDAEMENKRQQLESSYKNETDQPSVATNDIKNWIEKQNKTVDTTTDIVVYDRFSKKDEGNVIYRGCQVVGSFARIAIYEKLGRRIVVPVTEKQFAYFKKQEPGTRVVLNRWGHAQFKQNNKNVHGR